MAVQDYTEFTSVANELIDEFGASVTLYKTQRTPHTPSQPYLGPANFDDSSPPANHKLDVTAVAVGNITGGVEGRMLADSLVSLIRVVTDGFVVKGPAALGVSLEDFNQVKQGTTLYRIKKIHPVQPGDTVVFYWIEVES